MAALLIVTFVLSFPPEGELTVVPGYGSVIWETGDEPPITSNTGLLIGGSRPYGRGRIGGSMLINAYSGDSQYHLGPGAVLLDITYSMRFPLDRDVMVRAGAGGAISVLFSRRHIPDGDAQGTYMLLTPGAGLVGELGMEYHLHPRIRIGILMRYYTMLYAPNCWSGPRSDCTGIDPDHMLQHWYVGLQLTYHHPRL